MGQMGIWPNGPALGHAPDCPSVCHLKFYYIERGGCVKDIVGGIPGHLRIALQRKALLTLSGFLPGMHALHALHAHKQTHASRRPQAHHQAFGPRLAPRASAPLSFKGKAARMYRWDGKKGNNGAGGREATYNKQQALLLHQKRMATPPPTKLDAGRAARRVVRSSVVAGCPDISFATRDNLATKIRDAHYAPTKPARRSLPSTFFGRFTFSASTSLGNHPHCEKVSS